MALPPTKRDAKRASHAAGATAPSSRAGAPTGTGSRIAKDPEPAVPHPARSKDQVAFPPAKRDAKRASHASGATTPSSKGGAPTGAGRIAKDLEPAVSIPQPQQGSAGSHACQTRCEASKPCLRSHNALQQRRRTNRRRADCKRPGARCFNPAAATRIGWLSRPPNAMRSEQAMPPEPQRPPAKEAHQQAQGGLQKTWSPLFQSRSRNKDRLALPPAKRDAKRASHASGATAPFSKGGAPTGAGLWRAKGPGPIVLYRFRGTEQWGFSRPAGGKSGGAGL